MTKDTTNYQRILDQTILAIPEGTRPRLLLHACCAPCSSYVLEYLSAHFDITLFFYNPNISPEDEHRFRFAELSRLVAEMGLDGVVSLLEGKYDPERFYALSRGLESLPEGGARCAKCYALRLSETADAARDGAFDYFTTTLSISPHKNAAWLNEIGAKESERVRVPYLFSDFKKKNGYRRSCELSAKYGLYRQDYCGCIFSKQAKEKREM